VRAERGRLAGATLTILRAYYLAGCPAQKLAPWGSFEEWSRLIRGCLVWVGLPDPIAAHAELRTRADADRVAIEALLCGIERLGEVSVAELIAKADFVLRAALEELCPLRRGEERLCSRRVGAKLAQLRERPFDVIEGKGRRRLVSKVGHGGALRWRVEDISGAAETSHQGAPNGSGDFGDRGDSVPPQRPESPDDFETRDAEVF
jgi:hypothetical protein